MKRLIFIGLLLAINFGVYAQSGSARDKIESARIALITDRLGLTPDQAEKFWPIYNAYRKELTGLRNEYETARRQVDPQTASEKEKRELLNLGLQLKERKVQLERDYSDRLLKVISTAQIMSLRKAEDDFRRMLLEQIQKRRMQDGRRNQIRDRS